MQVCLLTVAFCSCLLTDIAMTLIGTAPQDPLKAAELYVASVKLLRQAK